MFEKILIILAITFIFYFRTLKYGPVSDDIPSLKTPKPFKNLWHKWYLRIYEGHKYNIAQDHLITLIIHTLVSVMIYVAFGKTDISFLAALLFSINPANNQGSIWCSGRGYTMPTLLLLTAIAFPIISPLCLFGVVYNPAGFISTLTVLGSQWYYLTFMLPILWFLHRKRITGIVKERINSQSVTHDKQFSWKKFIIAIKTMGWYFTLCLIPFRIAFYHSFMESMSGDSISQKRALKIDKFFFIGVSVIVYLIYSLWNWTPVSWGVWWFAIGILPFCNFLRMNQEIAERYLYLANVGVMFALSNVIIQWPVTVAIFLTIYATRLIYLIPMYTDDFWIVEYSVMEDPRSWYGWHIRGHKQQERGCLQTALTMWVMAKLLCPKSFKILFNIGAMLRLMGKKEESDKFFAQSKANIIPGQEEFANGLFKDLETGKMPFLI